MAGLSRMTICKADEYLPAPDCRRVLVCASGDLSERGDAVRFDVLLPHGVGSGFAVRFSGMVYAYLNQCAHVPVEMDWSPGQFFDHSRLYLICSFHGAMYEPETGRCVAGPCRGARLRPLAVCEENGQVYWLPDNGSCPPAPKPVEANSPPADA